MNTHRESKRFALRLFALAAAAFLFLSTWAAAGGPVDDFPGFISSTANKIGDVAIDKTGNVYVSVSVGAFVKIWKFSPAGEPSFVADIGEGVAYGLALDANGDIYAAITGTGRGVYRVGRDGISVRLPGTEHIFYANAMAFDQRGNLYVTESTSGSPGAYGQGGIWRIPPGGEAELMLRHELLTGRGVLGAPIGANGIAYYHGELYVANCDWGFIVRIPIRPNGRLGQPENWATLQEVPGSPLAGSPLPVMPDGLALDVHGNVYIALVSRLAVVRINAGDTPSQETIALFSFIPNAPLFAPLDTPNSLAFGTGKGGRQSLFVTNLGLMTGWAPGFPWSGPGLMKIDADTPGLPLP